MPCALGSAVSLVRSRWCSCGRLRNRLEDLSGVALEPKGFRWFTCFCFSGDFLFWVLLKGLLGNSYFLLFLGFLSKS